LRKGKLDAGIFSGDTTALDGIPVYAPNGARREADVVNLGYVVNVMEDPSERREVLRRAWSLAR
jgi:hypothetical protein